VPLPQQVKQWRITQVKTAATTAETMYYGGIKAVEGTVITEQERNRTTGTPERENVGGRNGRSGSREEQAAAREARC
jgi:hypothetical protein